MMNERNSIGGQVRRMAGVLGLTSVALLAFVGCGEEPPECEAVSAETAALLDSNVVAAVRGPADPFLDTPQWYYASPTGGLWISDEPPEADGDAASVLPMNEQARTESIAGIDVAPSAPVFEGTDVDSAAAQEALACAAERGPNAADTELSPEEAAFLDQVLEADPNQDPASAPDLSGVSDAEMVISGQRFCDELVTLDGEGAAEGIDPTPQDFSTVAEGPIAVRFEEVTTDAAGGDMPNGAVVAAYEVGIAAVENLCPDLIAALG